MRLRMRLRVNSGITTGVVLSLVAMVGWSSLAENRARADEELARGLQEQAMERGVVRDEYLLHPEARVRSQLEVKSAELAELLVRARAAFRDPVDRATLDDIAANLERSTALFHLLADLPAEAGAGEGTPSTRAELRARLTIQMLRISRETHGLASRLAGSASARAAGTQRRTLVLVLVMMTGVVVVTTVNAFQVNRLLQRRIGVLREGAERVSLGHLEHQTAVVGDDELADLARAFDAMTARLQEAKRGMEASNRELEAFSYSVSHDLRAPLRHVVGFVELLQQSAPEGLDERSRHYLQVISEAARKMGVLIDDLLAFSRVGRSEMSRSAVSLQRLVEEVVKELAPTAGGREVAWEIGVLPEVPGDEAMLRQVWRNLLGNALKFTRPRAPARISIGAEPAGPGEVELHVKDNGVGFDMQYSGKLFQVFQRLHPEAEFEGTGIGLAIVQRIVHRHGGRVRAEGVPGEGATFRFTLPTRGDGP
jgi:signal transduction histidine kinase